MSINFEREVTGVWISPDGTEALATDCQTLVRIDLTSQRTTTVELAEFAFGDQAQFSRDGKLLAYKSGLSAKVFNTKTGKEICEVKSASGIQSIAFSPDNRRLLTGDQGIVSVWDTANGNRIEAIPSGIDNYLNQIAFSPDNWHFAVTAGYTPVVVLRLGRQ
jgi:WD40 repeat protein